MSTRPILIMAGGTGGHVYPALAVARALLQESQQVVWLGTQRGLEARVVPAAGIDIEWVSVGGLRGKGLGTLLAAPFRLLVALGQSLRVVHRHRPAAVLGMGGFVSGPGGLAAWILRRPLVIHEQNAVAGLTNRLLARLARVVLQAFPGSFSPRLEPLTVGNPVRADIAALPPPAERLSGREGPARLLVIGGSLGALKLNQVVPAAVAALPLDQRPEIRHQTGERTAAEAADAYRQAGVTGRLSAYIEDMAEAYRWADIIVCRAGALTVAEVAAVGLPAFFIPYPSAVDDHQTVNAKGLSDSGAAVTIQERELTPEVLATALAGVINDRGEVLRRAALAREAAQPDALERIAGLCLEAAGAGA